MIGYSIETPIISIFYLWVFGHITTYGQTDRLTMFSYTHSDVVTDSHKSFSNVSCGCESWTCRFVGEPVDSLANRHGEDALLRPLSQLDAES